MTLMLASNIKLQVEFHFKASLPCPLLIAVRMPGIPVQSPSILNGKHHAFTLLMHLETLVIGQPTRLPQRLAHNAVGPASITRSEVNLLFLLLFFSPPGNWKWFLPPASSIELSSILACECNQTPIVLFSAVAAGSSAPIKFRDWYQFRNFCT